jgi:hypothetical protein
MLQKMVESSLTLAILASRYSTKGNWKLMQDGLMQAMPSHFSVGSLMKRARLYAYRRSILAQLERTGMSADSLLDEGVRDLKVYTFSYTNCSSRN